ncbi:MAG: methylated-DNA--[protein]-cysteine S-methyltransferase [Mariprofundaceae bacterium]|nr:methylated-DNA--[protein]-cysteine S-methyltransferase [Mariprofundaceae bacterium]
MSAQTHLFRYESPLGPIGLELAGDVCHHITLGSTRAPECSPDHPMALWLRAYFMGSHLNLPPIAPPNTLFQKRLRKALLEIPFGETRTYGELAKALNSAPRAVGQSLGANPLPILIPCHRIVAADGLGGFACGLAWKKRLLKFEKAM